ncbi:alpha/beta fold hydrolase [Sphingobacterium spiritivorum]|uniref:alpha/beta fold hydrolase n=1 Tax=Sphingobacterium spiritivorum TaxID=258 RepID=UPI003DA67C39
MPKVEYTEYYSHMLGRTINIQVTGHYGLPVIMFPTSQGSFTQNSDFHLNASVDYFTDNGKIKLFNLETLDQENLYNTRIPPHERIARYENYMLFLFLEYIPFIQKTHNVHRVAVAGCSFGAFHATNFAFRFPDVVSHLIAMSGAFSIRNFMDGYSSETVYFNCPEEFMQNDASWKFGHMHIVLSTSDQDVCLNKNLRMSEILRSKGIDHWYDEAKWIDHDWPLWRMVFPRFIGTYFS